MNRIDREIEATVTDVSHWTFLVPDQIMIEWALKISKRLNMIFSCEKKPASLWCDMLFSFRCAFNISGQLVQEGKNSE